MNKKEQNQTNDLMLVYIFASIVLRKAFRHDWSKLQNKAKPNNCKVYFTFMYYVDFIT